ncbi:SDR family NAD(P)-dependent oxidoreductase, partial [Aeromonas schubertii]|uniref:SDR family NAD(P)-dependent oxidoreductase n=1 Tax=Aeromonas schubertii TaxID=652 RepID=UPI0038B5A2C9
IKILPLKLDVSDVESIKHMKDQIRKEFGRLDILVNGAGISPKGKNGRVPFEKIELEEWKRVLNVNLTGSFLCSQVAIEFMKEQR